MGLLLAALLFLGVWRVSRELPDLLRKAEETIAEESGRFGLKVTFRNLRFQPLHLRVSLDDLAVDDALSGLPLARAGHVDLAISPSRLLSGYSPVSRVRVRDFSLRVEEGNRPLLEKIRAARGDGDGDGAEPIPEILLLDGRLEVGPLGPLERWEAAVEELRVRDVRFLGTQVTTSLRRAAGVVDLPGVGRGTVPLDSADIDLLVREGGIRIRKFRAGGDAASLSISGVVDIPAESAGLSASGQLDIGKWIEAGGAGGSRLAAVATRGTVDFSAQWEGTLERPDASAKLVLRRGLLLGDTAVEADLSAALAGRSVRVTALRGTLLGGTLEGSGAYDLKAGKGEGRLSLARATLGAAPWQAWGIPWRPVGPGSVEIAVSGGPEKIRYSVSAGSPGGLERPGDRIARVTLPVALAASGELEPGRILSAETFRVQAGKAALTGKGSYRFAEGGIETSGGLSVPAGKVSQFGWNYPVSWNALEGEWQLSGTVDRLRVAAGVKARGLAARALPPVPVTVKIEGDPAAAIHFVADVPAPVATVTAAGTVTGPLSPEPPLLDATVAAREIDFSQAGRWVSAVWISLGKDPGDPARYASDLSGTGSADLQLSFGRGDFSVAGSLVSEELRTSGVPVRALSATGEWRRREGAALWEARASGAVGDGAFVVTGTGRDGDAGISATMEKVDLGWAVSLFDTAKGARISGTAEVALTARTGEKGWEVDRLTAAVPRLTLRDPPTEGGAPGGGVRATWEAVSVEGSFAEASGELSVSAASPAMRATGTIRRAADWPATFSFAAEEVPTAFLLAAAGMKLESSGGAWNAEGEGAVRAGALLGKDGVNLDAVTEFRFSATADSPAAAGVSFGELRASGKKEGRALTAEIETRAPDSRLSCSVGLSEPFAFRVEGPFSIGGSTGRGEPQNGEEAAEERAQFALAGTAQLAGSLRVPESTRGSLSVRDMRVRARGFELTGSEVSLQLSPEGIRWAGGSLRAAGSPLLVSGRASWSGDLDVRLEGAIPAAAARLATGVFDRLGGVLRVNVRLTGTWNDPSLIGTGRLEGGTLSFREYAQVFEDMSADLVFSRERIVFESFQGRSGGGYLDGRGEIPLRFAEGQRMYLSVDFFNMRYPYPADIRPVLQGHVELLGPLDDLLIAGDVEVQSARYTKTIRPERAFLDFRRRLADVTARREETPFRIRLDIEAIADGTILIRNNLAEATAKGEFRVVGDTSRVILLGSFDVIEGTVNYRGNRYQITRAVVDFQDPLRNNPRIDASAETRRGNVAVTVSVTGTLEKYEVELNSDPPLSKNDIVALLSLGVTAEKLTGAEGSVSAGEAAAIAFGPYTGRVEERIRGIVGLDTFAIEPAFSSADKSFEPRFRVGKAFGERLSLSVSTSVGTTAESSAAAEFKVFENVFLQGSWRSATTTREGDLGGDVKFRYRFQQIRDIFQGRD